MARKRLSHIYLYALLSTLAGTLSCRKDVSVFLPYEASIAELRQTLDQVPDPATHSVFVLNHLSNDTILTTAGGVRVFLTDTDALFQDESGTAVPCSACPDLRLEVTEVLKKGDILSRGLPTTTANDKPMESVGIVELRVFCQNKQLKLLSDRYIKVQLPSDELKPNLSLWTAVTDGATISGWQNSNVAASVNWAEWPKAGGGTQTGYELIAKDLGWLNAGALITDPTTSFCVKLPLGYDAENSQVFVLLLNSRSVFALSGDVSDNTFCIDGAPVGYPVQLVTLTKLGDQFLLGNAQSEIGNNATIQIEPAGSSEGDIIQFLKHL